MFQWRRFQFFDREVVKDEATGDSGGPLQPVDIACCTSGRGRLIFGGKTGLVTLADRQFKFSTFQAFDGPVLMLHQLKTRNILVSVGTDSTVVVKFWRLDKVDKRNNPVCAKTMKLFSSKFPECQITCLTSSEDLSHLAVGFANGAVLFFSGDVLRDRFPKIRQLQPSGAESVSAVGLRESPHNRGVTSLFVVTEKSVNSYIIRPNGDLQLEVLDMNGCPPGCAVMSVDHELVVGRAEAVFFYEADERGPCFAFEGDKKCLFWFRSYLLIVSNDRGEDLNSVTIYDLKNKFIAFSANVSAVDRVLYEWGSVFLLCSDKKLLQITEKDTQTKLEMLFKKNLYAIAISLAKSSQCDVAAIMDIVRKYGDHLYSKGDFDGAISQYTSTIGRLEPSYVIRKFLDAQRIKNLTGYLEALHGRREANCDHTTLLLNCYTKTKEIDKLAAFIQNDGSNFEVETAIKVCRQAGYFDHALYLAQKHDYHDQYIRIQLDDQHEYSDALQYIGTLNFFEAEKNLKKHGKSLVEHVPSDTTQLLMRLCTHYTPVGGDGALPTPEPLTVPGAHAVQARSDPAEFIHIFVNQPKWLLVFLEFIVSKDESGGSSLLYNTLLELYLRIPEDDPLTDQQRALVPAGNSATASKVSRREKALLLLQNQQAKYDADHALVLVQMHHFQAGMLYLYEKLCLYQEIIQYYMDGGDWKALIDACKRYGDKEPNLWVQALSFFAAEEDSRKEISEILTYIERDNLLPPLLVVQILAGHNSRSPLSVIKDYLSRRLREENQAISEDQRLVRMYTEETDKMRSELDGLRCSAKIFQSSKCSACTGPLDLPAVHFMCMHSFHQRCLADNEKECPVCAPNTKKTIDIKKSLEVSAGDHEQFFKQLEGSADGFSTVSEFFGRGIFSKVILIGDESNTQQATGAGLDRESLLS